MNSSINEFYLNSHIAIQGTSKPCKYSLIYDEIGFKVASMTIYLFFFYCMYDGCHVLQMSELELLTYWLTYLYCRCTKSVSYATPAYYAHWAARRGKVLLTAGATSDQLKELSKSWLAEDMLPGMYFI